MNVNHASGAMRPSDIGFRLSRRLSRRGLPHERYTAAGARLLPGPRGFKYFLQHRHLDEVDVVTANYEVVRDAAQRAGVEPFAVSASSLRGVRLGIEPDAVGRLLDGLRAVSAELPITVGLTCVGRENVSGLAYRVLDPPPDPATVARINVYSYFRETSTGRRFTGIYGCTLEVWREDDEGGLEAPTANRRVSFVAPEDRERRSSVSVLDARASTFPPLASPDPFKIHFPIDVVYLWVDGDDPEWQQRKEERLAEVEGHAHATTHAKAVNAVRFEQGDELRFSLRSVYRYAPWVRRIFVVTDRQRPDWLKEDPGTLDVVDHTEILPASSLPTFNSHAITAAVHHVSGLSDRFLLLNDDVIFGRPVSPERFFYSNGATKFFTSRAALPSDGSEGENPPVTEARRRSRDVIEALTGLRPSHGFKHTPIAFDRQLLADLEAEVPEWRATQDSPFRTGSDIVPEWLHHYIGYHRRRSFPGKLRYSYVDIGNPQHLKGLRRLLSKGQRPDVFCVNDVTWGLVDGQSRHEALQRILEAMLPRPSPFETDVVG